jgi:hypothetical protein
MFIGKQITQSTKPLQENYFLNPHSPIKFKIWLKLHIERP